MQLCAARRQRHLAVRPWHAPDRTALSPLAGVNLYASVDARKVEIATLRAIGFRGMPVIVSVLAEGVLLALPAALLGAAIDWYLFNGHVVVATQITFPMAVTPRLVLIALCWAVSIALIGGILPSIRAARVPVATAIRAA